MADQQTIVTLDLEGVLVPEIWIAVAESTGIEALRRTTRDEPDYDVLMRYRLDLLAEHGLTLSRIQEVIGGLAPLPGAVEFLASLRERTQVVILSDTFEQFAEPLMRQLGWPALLCHRLVVEDDRVVGYQLRMPDPKRAAVHAFQGLNYRVLAAGDSYNDTTMLLAADAGFLFHAPANVVAEFPQLPALDDYDELLEAVTGTRLNLGSWETAAVRGLGAARLALVGAIALVGCGGGEGDEQDEIELVPAVAVEPCDLLDEEQAADLSGGEVEPAESSVADDGTATCSFAASDGSAIAASLTIGPGSEDDLPTGTALARSLDLGDAGAVEEGEDEVRVVYVVEEVVVSVQVAPADGEVTDALVEEVIDFAESTVEPVKQAIQDDPAPEDEDEDEDTTTTTDAPEETTTTVEATTTTVDDGPEVLPIEIGGAPVTATFAAGEELVYGFEGSTGQVILIEVLDLAADDPAVDQTNPCMNILIVAPSGGFTAYCSFDLAQRPAMPLDLTEDGTYTITVQIGGTSSSSATFRIVAS